MLRIKGLAVQCLLLTVLSTAYAQDVEADKAIKGSFVAKTTEEPFWSNETNNEWSYDNITGPEFWPTLGHDQCAGNQQSPINIDSENIPKYEYSDLLDFKHYDDEATTVTVKNNGHTLVATFGYAPATWRPSVSGGQLGGTYEFEQLHFHWGNRGDSKHAGAEHTIDGIRGPLEMHMVHRNVKYSTMAQAVNNSDGILVLAAIFEMNTNNVMPLLRSVESVKPLVTHFNGTATLKKRALSTVLPSDTTGFFRYRGSLTTPGCQQSVDWVIFEHRSHVIVGQVKMLGTLKNRFNRTIVHNFRPTQKLNDRKIYHMVYKGTGQVQTESSAPGPALPGVTMAAAALMAIAVLSGSVW